MWFRNINGNHLEEVQARLEELLEYWLRRLRDINQNRDYFESFRIDPRGPAIIFHNPTLAPEEREQLVLEMNAILAGFEWLEIGVVQPSKSPPDMPGLSFSVEIGKLGRWKGRRRKKFALAASKELLGRAECVGQQIYWRSDSIANRDPLTWNAAGVFGINSVMLEVKPNEGRRYPAGSQYVQSFREEVEGILEDFPELNLRLARIIGGPSSARAILDYVPATAIENQVKEKKEEDGIHRNLWVVPWRRRV